MSIEIVETLKAELTHLEEELSVSSLGYIQQLADKEKERLSIIKARISGLRALIDSIEKET